MKNRKILYSPGWGAGWTTWNGGEVAKYMLTYQPIIDFIESGQKFSNNDCHDSYNNGVFSDKNIHPLLQQLRKECNEKFGHDNICILGADQLRVAEVYGKIKIEEYDGSESYITKDSDDGWM